MGRGRSERRHWLLCFALLPSSEPPEEPCDVRDVVQPRGRELCMRLESGNLRNLALP